MQSGMAKILFKFNGNTFREEPLRSIVLSEMHDIVLEHHSKKSSKKPGRYLVVATDGSSSQTLYDVYSNELNIMAILR